MVYLVIIVILLGRDTIAESLRIYSSGRLCSLLQQLLERAPNSSGRGLLVNTELKGVDQCCSVDTGLKGVDQCG